MFSDIDTVSELKRKLRKIEIALEHEMYAEASKCLPELKSLVEELDKKIASLVCHDCKAWLNGKCDKSECVHPF